MIGMIGGWLESAIRAAPESSRTIVAIQVRGSRRLRRAGHDSAALQLLPLEVLCSAGRQAPPAPGPPSLQILLWVSAFVSGLIDNIPYVSLEPLAHPP